MGSEVSDGKGPAVWRFSGIKYATAERWAPPKPATCDTNWNSELSFFYATAYGPMCPQPNNFPVPLLFLATWVVVSLGLLLAAIRCGSSRVRAVGSECFDRTAAPCLRNRYDRLREDKEDNSNSRPYWCCTCSCCAVTAAVLSLLLSLVVASSTEPSPTLGREDCLFLNVWRPSAADTPSSSSPSELPVFAFIHGGNLNFGSSSDMGDPTAWVRDYRVVVVSMNYRLAALGFLTLDALEGANYGFADQMESLRWIKAHIGAFGGDPARVTVMGESSGGTSVLALLASPTAGAEALFQRAIALSAGTRIDQAAADVRRRNVEDGRGLVQRTRCGDLAPTILLASASALAAFRACLYGLTAEELVAAKPAAWGDASWTFDLPAPYAGVSADVESSDDPRFLDEAGAVGHLGVYAAVGLPGGILPKPLPEAYRLPATTTYGMVNRPSVPAIIWVMAEETDGGNVDYSEFVPDSDSASAETLRDTLVERLKWKFGAMTSAVVGEIISQPWYSVTAAPERGTDANAVITPQRAYSRIATDLRMRCGAAVLADALAEGAGASRSSDQQAVSVYHVVMDQGPGPGDAHPILGDWSRGLIYTPRWAFHGWDVMLLYGWALPWPVHQYSAADLRLQRVVRSALTEFGAMGSVRGWEPCDLRDEGWCSGGTLDENGWGAAPEAAAACRMLASHFGIWNYTLSG